MFKTDYPCIKVTFLKVTDYSRRHSYFSCYDQMTEASWFDYAIEGVDYTWKPITNEKYRAGLKREEKRTEERRKRKEKFLKQASEKSKTVGEFLQRYTVFLNEEEVDKEIKRRKKLYKELEMSKEELDELLEKV